MKSIMKSVMNLIREAELDDLAAIVAIEQRSHSTPWSREALSSSLQNSVALRQEAAQSMASPVATTLQTSTTLKTPTTPLNETVDAVNVVPMHQFLVLQVANDSSAVGSVPKAIVAYLVALNVADEANLLHIVVDTDAQQQGYASHLLRHWFKQLAQAEQPKTVWLEVRRSNSAAQSLYDKHGFEQMSVRKKYYQVHKAGHSHTDNQAHETLTNSAVEREDAMIYRRFIGKSGA